MRCGIGTPTISGTASFGKTLTAAPGTWKPAPTVAYRWHLDGVPVSGAGKKTWTLPASAVGKKVTVVEKDTDKEIEVTITDDTEYVTPKKSGKVDLERLAKGIEKAKERGKQGIRVKVTHEKGVASKIETTKKAEQ